MAQALTDKGGRTWSLDLTIGTAIRIDDATGFDLLADSSFIDQKPTGMAAALPELERSPVKLAKVLAAACRPEIEARNLTPDQFLSSWDGPALKKAYVTLVEAICDFFPDRAPQIRRMAAALAEGRVKTAEANEKLTEGTRDLLSKIDVEALIGEALKQAEGELAKIPGSGSGSSPG